MRGSHSGLVLFAIWRTSSKSSKAAFATSFSIPELYDRPAIYGEPDDHLRFAALCQGALGVARHLFAPKIIHGHDWQAGLLPVFLKDTYENHPAYLGIETVLTIHNLGYQGQFPVSALADLGLPRRLYDSGVLEFLGGV